MKPLDLEKLNKLANELPLVFTDEEILTIFTSKEILATRILGENPTESLAASLCLRSIEILLDALKAYKE